MSEKETIDVGIAKAYEVMRALKINNDQLVPCEYLDMQQASNCVDINDKKKWIQYYLSMIYALPTICTLYYC